MLIDTHAHLYLNDYAEDLSEVVNRAKLASIEKVLLPNIDISTIKLLKNSVFNYPDFFSPMMGLHPNSVTDNYKEKLDIVFNELNIDNDYIAIGEIGIDLYWDKTYFKEQVEAFETQLKWSVEKDKPVVIHSRNSYKVVLNSLNRLGSDNLRGVFHSFSGDVADLKEILKCSNFYIGINGIVTFKNSNLREVLINCPPERIVLETDSPYLSPAPYRGKRNEPMHLKQINQTLSDIYNIEFEEMAQIAKTNSIRLFDLNV